MQYLGIDLGGTNIAAGLVDEHGEVLFDLSCPTGSARGPQAVVDDMAALCAELLQLAGATYRDVAAIGVGTPGVCDARRGTLVFANNLHFTDVPIAAMLQQALPLPVFLENDATAAGIAEHELGALRGVDNGLFVTLGTGIGGCLFIDGKVYAGTHGYAAEIGHMVTHAGGDVCTCGLAGCWERYAAAPALIRAGRAAAKAAPRSLLHHIVNGNLQNLTAKDVVDCARAGDETALSVFHAYVHELALGVIGLIHLYDPAVVCLGGGVAQAGEFLLQPLKEAVAAGVMYKALPHARLCLTALAGDAGIVGAAMLGKAAGK